MTELALAPGMNPGVHRVTVVPLGGIGVSKSATLAEGARLSLEVELAGAAPAVIPRPSRPPSRRRARSCSLR